MKWQDDIVEHLAHLHPCEIIEGIIKPAVKQVIEDIDDGLQQFDTSEKEQKIINEEIIERYKDIQKRL